MSALVVQIAQLPSLSRQELLDLWRRAYRKSPPLGIRREILVPFLAYKLQERVYGGLKPSTRSELRRIARGLQREGRASQSIIQSKIKRGTRLLRRWRGEIHEVVAVDPGYEYRGGKYRSLSQIARMITGTQWSGPAFFGLRKSNSALSKHND